ncbi:energy transducer TonB [Zoogloea sp.]|uniref:energy transducer TonB n=1 Tax=Zoogloea sp. TaxID=49181 RepID=UPI0035AE44BE
MNAAMPLAAQPTQALPAPVLLLSRQDNPLPVRRSMVGTGVAVALHLALLGLFFYQFESAAPPVTPPQPYMTVSLVTPDTPKQTPPQPRPTQPAVSKPQPVAKQRPAPPTMAPSKPTLISAATATNAVEATAPAAQPAPPAPPVQAAAKEAPVTIVPPRFDAAYLSNPAPEYPRLSRRMGEEGRVLLKVQVGADGRPTDVSVFKSSGFTRLDESARDTVLHSWRFVPARQGDQTVAGTVKVPIDFTLNPAS